MKSLLDDRIQDSDVHDELIFTSSFNDPLPSKAVSMNKVHSVQKMPTVAKESTRSLGANVLMKLYSPERKSVSVSILSE